ncbi:MAG: 2OG-Fe(II) oxygenase [Novosphingobium sp.]
MAVLSLTDLGGYGAFDLEQCRQVGSALAERYRANDPFPHIMLEDFLDPDLLRQVVAEFPDSSGESCFLRNQERLKFQYPPEKCRGAATRQLLGELNSQAFLTFLSEMTGIEGLIPDPYFSGAGLHETKRGGHLGIHADFPQHAQMKLLRRLNLLIYLNDDWDEGYGGALELWDKRMRTARHRILPTLGRAVVFTTARDTFHGHPDPLTCPENRSRRSIATYYYTANDVPQTRIERTTDFQQRPRSGDRRDWSIKWQHFKADWLPPALQRRSHA